MLYLIHFDRPHRHARHCLGYCKKGRIEERIQQHRNNTGARLLQVVNSHGIGWSLVRTWLDGDRTQERRMKTRGHLPDYCPICKGLRNAKRRVLRWGKIEKWADSTRRGTPS